MKFIVSSSQLLKKLQQISGAINTGAVLPILGDFLFEINDTTLTITATDLETVMKVHMEVSAKQDMAICIPSKMLLEYLKNVPDQPLTFDVQKNNSIEITSDNGKYKIMGEDAAEYPKDPEPTDTTPVTLTDAQLLTAINKTVFVTSNDDLRPAMMGVLFEIKTDGINFVATDAHRLVKFSLLNMQNEAERSIIVPKKPLNLVKSIIPHDDEAVTLQYNSSHLFINHSQVKISCRLIDARFPDYSVVIPAKNPYQLTVNKSDFIHALKRVSIFSNKSTNQVVLNITGNELQLTSQDLDFNFEGSERLTASYDGENMQIGFNAKFLIDMLQAVDTDEVFMFLSTPQKAGIITPSEEPENEKLLMLVMPIMINN